MTILLIELNPNTVLIDESLFPDRQKDEFIYEHLRHYCSKFYPLPTIEIQLYKGLIYVIKNHIYVTIAKELKHPYIRAFIKKSSEGEVTQLLQNPSVIQLDWKNIISETKNEPLVEFVWLIFFFIKPLKQKDQIIFEEQIVYFYRHIQLPEWSKILDERIKNLNYPYGGYCAEFEAYIPIEDERWYPTSIAVLKKFHHNCVPIISFQGAKFRFE